MNPKADPPEDPAERLPSSPYGPQPYGEDEAAGGADSSPHESEPTGERTSKDAPDTRQADVPN